jgi:hypothetical protein
VKALAMGSAAAIFLGMCYAFTFYYIPFVYLNCLMALAFGGAVGYIVGWGAREGNIRNTPVTVGLAVVAAFVGIYAEWGTTLYAVCDPGMLLALWEEAGLEPFLPHKILEVMLALYDEGSWGLTEGQMVKGWTLVTLWLLEAAAIVGLAAVTAYAQIAGRPFCEPCGAWITGEAPHLYIGDGSEPVWGEVLAGNFDTLADTLRATGNEPTYVRLKLHACDTCEASNYLTITTCENTVDHRGNPKTVEKDLITNLTIDRTQVELIRTANMIAPTPEIAELQGLVPAREWTMRKPEEEGARDSGLGARG